MAHPVRDRPGALERLTALCLSLASSTGDGRFKVAAAILAGKRPGRRPTDDSSALSYAEGLVRSGLVSNIHKACERAAELFAPTHQVETTRDRLRRKLRTKLNTSQDPRC